MCDTEHRLGSGPGAVEEIKAHPFFEGLDWKNLRNAKAPFLADLKADDDCTRFDKFEEEEPFYATATAAADDKKRRQRKDINFVGYTFKKDVEEQKINLVKVLNESLQAELGSGGVQDTTVTSSGSTPGGVVGGQSTTSGISQSSSVGGASTPQQKQMMTSSTAEQSQTHSNFYM